MIMQGKWPRRVLASGLMATALLYAVGYQIDHNPIGKWVDKIRVHREISRLRNGTISERFLAANLLGPMGMGREDARNALLDALKDIDPGVRAEAALSLRFYHHQPVAVTRETWRISQIAWRSHRSKS